MQPDLVGEGSENPHWLRIKAHQHRHLLPPDLLMLLLLLLMPLLESCDRLKGTLALR